MRTLSKTRQREIAERLIEAQDQYIELASIPAVDPQYEFLAHGITLGWAAALREVLDPADYAAVLNTLNEMMEAREEENARAMEGGTDAEATDYVRAADGGGTGDA